MFERFYIDALVEAGMPPTALAREKALAREAAQKSIVLLKNTDALLQSLGLSDAEIDQLRQRQAVA